MYSRLLLLIVTPSRLHERERLQRVNVILSNLLIGANALKHSGKSPPFGRQPFQYAHMP